MNTVVSARKPTADTTPEPISVERRFYREFLASNYGPDFKAAFLLSDLCPPEFLFDVLGRDTSDPCGLWDNVDLAFAGREGKAINLELQRLFTAAKVSNPERIPNSFFYGDCGWSGSDPEMLASYAQRLGRANKSTRLIGWEIPGSTSIAPADVPAELQLGSYDVVHFTGLYSLPALPELAKGLCRPGGVIVVTYEYDSLPPFAGMQQVEVPNLSREQRRFAMLIKNATLDTPLFVAPDAAKQ
jgi:hypothetical protein